MQYFKIFLTLILLSNVALCLAKEQSDSNLIIEGNNKFAFELYGKLKDQQGNLFLSPYSISTALAMSICTAHEARLNSKWLRPFSFRRHSATSNSIKSSAR